MKIPRKHFQLSESVILGGLAILVGLTSGAGVWLFKWLIDQVKWLIFDQLGVTLQPLGGWTVVLLPLLLQDLNRHEPDTWQTRLVGDSCTHQLIVTHPDESIGAALRKMGARDIGRLPVVARNEPEQLVGMLRRNDLVRAYDGALTRRAKLRHSAHQVRLDALTPEAMQVVEVAVAPGSACAAKPIKAIAWPAGAIVASIQRKQQLLIPHGDTILRAGDVLVIVADESSLEAVQALGIPE